MDTLALGYVIPAIRAHSGLTPVRQSSCRAYQEKEVVSKVDTTPLFIILLGLHLKGWAIMV